MSFRGPYQKTPDIDIVKLLNERQYAGSGAIFFEFSESRSKNANCCISEFNLRFWCTMVYHSFSFGYSKCVDVLQQIEIKSN